MSRSRLFSLAILALPIAAAAAQQPATPTASAIDIPFQKYVAPNGLTVVLVENHSTPLVAVQVLYHVGSKNEVLGRTGFAHMFEHVMFTGSGHVPYGLHDKYTEGVGGGNNGSTNSDATVYYETIPSNYLETALWLESDRMGFLLDSLDEAKFRAQRDIVKNERRERTDNIPYRRDNEIVANAMYPKMHPYSWPTIGSMTDLGNATVEDVKRFFRLYYAPNNATLVIVGDFDAAKTKGWITKYFGDLPKGAAIVRPRIGAHALTAEKRITFEDRVQVPRLNINWPSVGAKSEDQPALDVLSDILGNTRVARIDKALVYDKQTAASISVFQNPSEDVGQFQVIATPRTGHTLTELETDIDSLIAQIKREGPTADELKRVKAGQQRSFFENLERNDQKMDQMAIDQAFFNDPAHSWRVTYPKTQAVTAEDVKRVANKYLGKARIVLSTVPVGKTDLAAHAEKSTIVTDPFTEKNSEVRP
jgi:zinc protease